MVTQESELFLANTHLSNIVSGRNLKRHCTLDLGVIKGVRINLLWSRSNFCLCYQPSFPPPSPTPSRLSRPLESKMAPAIHIICRKSEADPGEGLRGLQPPFENFFSPQEIAPEAGAVTRLPHYWCSRLRR